MTEGFTISEQEDPERVLTYTSGTSPYRNSMGGIDTLLYGRGLEERYKLAREPLRVCDVCFEELKPLQLDLRASNSNAVRYNSIDPTDIKRLFNSPLAFTLGHEIRKVTNIKIDFLMRFVYVGSSFFCLNVNLFIYNYRLLIHSTTYFLYRKETIIYLHP